MFFNKVSEKGYSLLEVTVAVGMMVLLLTIGVPAFTTTMKATEENNAKAALVNASVILENERYRNNGTYPTTTPTQITRSTEMSNINITMGSQNLSYCMSYATDRGRTFYLASTDDEPYPSETNACTTAALNP